MNTKHDRQRDTDEQDMVVVSDITHALGGRPCIIYCWGLVFHELVSVDGGSEFSACHVWDHFTGTNTSFIYAFKFSLWFRYEEKIGFYICLCTVETLVMRDSLKFCYHETNVISKHYKA